MRGFKHSRLGGDPDFAIALGLDLIEKIDDNVVGGIKFPIDLLSLKDGRTQFGVLARLVVNTNPCLILIESNEQAEEPMVRCLTIGEPFSKKDIHVYLDPVMDIVYAPIKGVQSFLSGARLY